MKNRQVKPIKIWTGYNVSCDLVAVINNTTTKAALWKVKLHDN